MAWTFETIAETSIFKMRRATPEDGSEQEFDSYGWETDTPGMVRRAGVSMVLGGVGRIDFDELNITVMYSGFSEMNKTTGRKCECPGGVATFYALKDLEYVCLLPTRHRFVLDYEVETEPFDAAPDYLRDPHLVVLEGTATHDGEVLEKFAVVPWYAPVTEVDGKVLCVWREERPRARQVPARPELMNEKRKRDTKRYDTRPVRERGCTAMAKFPRREKP